MTFDPSQYAAPTTSGGSFDPSQYASGQSVDLHSLATQVPDSPSMVKSFFSNLGAGISGTAKALTSPIVGGAKEVAKDTSQAFQGGINQIKQGASQFGKGGDIVGPSLNVGAGVVNTALSPLTAPFKPVGNAINSVAGHIANNPNVQNFANSKAGQVTSQAMEPLANAGTIAQGVLLAEQTPKLIEQGANAVNAVGEAAKPGFEAVGKDISNAGAKVSDVVNQAKDLTAKTPEEVAAQSSKLAGKITQGKIEDLPQAQEALTSIDTKGIKNYQDLSSALSSKIKEVAKAQDAALNAKPEPIALEDLTSNGHNFVQDALKQLSDYYEKTNDITGMQKIEALTQKAENTGLSIKEVNDLARVHGSELNAYNANGELASGLTKQAAENTRQGLKATVNENMGEDYAKTHDPQLSSLINTRDLIDKVAEKANALGQKIQQRGLLGKIGYYTGKAIDLATGGALKNFINYFIPRGEGLKTLNPLDLESQLQKNLQMLQKLSTAKLSDADFTTRLNKLVDSVRPNVGLSIEDTSAKTAQAGDTLARLKTQRAKLVAQGLSEKSSQVKNIDKTLANLQKS